MWLSVFCFCSAVRGFAKEWTASGVSTATGPHVKDVRSLRPGLARLLSTARMEGIRVLEKCLRPGCVSDPSSSFYFVRAAQTWTSGCTVSGALLENGPSVTAAREHRRALDLLRYTPSLVEIHVVQSGVRPGLVNPPKPVHWSTAVETDFAADQGCAFQSL